MNNKSMKIEIENCVTGQLRRESIEAKIHQAISDIDSGKYTVHKELVKKLNIKH